MPDLQLDVTSQDGAEPTPPDAHPSSPAQAVLREPASPRGRVPRPRREPTESTWSDLSVRCAGQARRELAAVERTALRRTGRFAPWIARLLRSDTAERRHRVAAEGQELVGARLNLLRGWHVLHSLPTGSDGTHLDHVVIGPGGVFCLVTKNHPHSTIRVDAHGVQVDGCPTAYLQAARADADRVHHLLSAATGFPVPVRATLVLLTGSLIPDVVIDQAPDDVLVYDRMDLPGTLRRAPRRLTDDQVSVIYQQARRSTTWTARHTGDDG